MDRPRTSLLACLFVVGLVLLPLEPAVALARDVQDDILAQTAGLRGLPPKAPVPFAFVDADQIRRDLLRDVDTEDAIRELGISQKLLVMLGLLRPDADLHAMLVNLYAENIQGYYNHLDKKMYIVSGQSAFGSYANGP